MSTKGCEGLYQTGYKGVGYVNHARVACNVTGLFARAGSLPKYVHARSMDERSIDGLKMDSRLSRAGC